MIKDFVIRFAVFVKTSGWKLCGDPFTREMRNAFVSNAEADTRGTNRCGAVRRVGTV